MITMLRRLFWLALLGGAGYACWTAWQRQNGSTAAGVPEWPPLDSTVTGAPDATSAQPAATTAGFASVATNDAGDDIQQTETGSSPTRWVEPVDGGCPDGYPIKANDNSGIYHVPGGRFYDRTGPERCYAKAEDAAADGYRAAKS